MTLLTIAQLAFGPRAETGDPRKRSVKDMTSRIAPASVGPTPPLPGAGAAEIRRVGVPMPWAIPIAFWMLVIGETSALVGVGSSREPDERRPSVATRARSAPPVIARTPPVMARATPSARPIWTQR
jgi:hypothetical protein